MVPLHGYGYRSSVYSRRYPQVDSAAFPRYRSHSVHHRAPREHRRSFGGYVDDYSDSEYTSDVTTTADELPIRSRPRHQHQHRQRHRSLQDMQDALDNVELARMSKLNGKLEDRLARAQRDQIFMQRELDDQARRNEKLQKELEAKERIITGMRAEKKKEDEKHAVQVKRLRDGHRRDLEQLRHQLELDQAEALLRTRAPSPEVLAIRPRRQARRRPLSSVGWDERSDMDLDDFMPRRLPYRPQAHQYDESTLMFPEDDPLVRSSRRIRYDEDPLTRRGY